MNARTERAKFAAGIAVAGVIYIASAYVSQPNAHLSREASAYQDMALEVVGGFGLSFGLANLAFLVAAVIWVSAILLTLLGKRLAVQALTTLPVFLILSSYLDGAEPAYPFLNSPLANLLLCFASAMWGSAVCYGVLRSNDLFATLQTGKV